ncbi:DUF6176 family protein [Hylemonella gracilis]|uniref:NIPSNAP domain-containing protein n=1 Tax=Hylemonella gracilis ATCC 19624 TaxID=887062 RepID=F3KTK8_9BURK|nr:DUF6176 family protein [Hylemonella gracilis]EGI76887.1 hypothetical protein HGR_08944 [Hylemonella gracilis ATCC 19624]
MKEVICVKVKLKPNSLERVRAWACEINARRPEALETLARESVWIESVFLDANPLGDYLIYYMRADSLDRATTAALESTAAIDAFHKSFKRETWSEVQKLELLVDLQRTSE